MSTFTRKDPRDAMIAAMDGDIDRDGMTALRDRLAPLVPFAEHPGRAEHGVDPNGLPEIVVDADGHRHRMSASQVLKGSSTGVTHALDGATRTIVLERTPCPTHCAPIVRAAHMLSIAVLAHDALDHLLRDRGMSADLLRSAAAAAAMDARRAEGMPEFMDLELTLHSPIRRWSINPSLERDGDDEPRRCPEAHDDLIGQEVPVIRASMIGDALHLIPVSGESDPVEDHMVVMRRIQALGEVHAHARRLGLMV